MHSSRMRSVRSSGRISGRCTWSQGGVPGPGGCTWSWGVPGPGGKGGGGVPAPGGGVCSGGPGVYLVLGGVPGLGGLLQGVYLVLGGVCSRGGCTWPRGVYLVPGGVPGQVLPPPPVDRQTPVKT